MKKLLLALCILGVASVSHAQTKVIVKQKTPAKSAVPYPSQTYSDPNAVIQPIGTPPAAGSVVATPAPEAAPKRSPWRIAYFGEYVGPRFENFDLARSQGPLDKTASYTGIDHSLKVGYGVAADIVLGTQIRANNAFDPTAKNSFSFYNLRFYGSWNHMVETDYVDIQQVLDVELPTTDASRTKGLIVRFNIKNNWTIKTALRNWAFTFQTSLSPRFYNTISGSTTDVAVGLFPWVTLDLAPDLQLVFEGSFDAGHGYQESFFDFSQGDPDFVNIGISWSANANISFNPAIRFYTYDMSPQTASIYLGVSASL